MTEEHVDIILKEDKDLKVTIDQENQDLLMLMLDDMAIRFSKPGFDRMECREFIHKLEDHILKLPQLPLENRHYFTHGVYARELRIPAGTILTGEIHTHDCFNFVMSGKIMILTEETPICIISAPMVSRSSSKIKKIGYALEDTVFVTTHPCETTELKKIEKDIFTKSYKNEDDKLIPAIGCVF